MRLSYHGIALPLYVGVGGGGLVLMEEEDL